MSTSGVREITKLMTQCLASEPDDRPTDVAAFSTLLAYVRPIVGVPNPPRTPRARARARAPPKPVDPSTLQSLPQLRQLLVQRSADAAPTPVIATPVEPAPPPAPPPPPPARTLPAHAPADVPRPSSNQQSAPPRARKPLPPP
jgi:hypothetical protein